MNAEIGVQRVDVGETVGYAHYPSGLCKPIYETNAKLRGFKMNGERPHIIVLLTNDPDFYEGALWTVQPFNGEIYKAGSVWKSAHKG